jgi:xanthine dehydrogenase YagS FAD-binding subunit
LALGAVAPRPWRARSAERLIRGGPATAAAFRAALTVEFAAAKPLPDNAFKIPLAENMAVALLAELVVGSGRVAGDEEGGVGK